MNTDLDNAFSIIKRLNYSDLLELRELIRARIADWIKAECGRAVDACVTETQRAAAAAGELTEVK